MNKTKVKNTIKRTIFIFLSVSIICHAFNKYKSITASPKINKKYDGIEYFATYSDGKVYICSKDNMKKVCSEATDDDIVVVDLRDGDDPDMQILKSYSVYDAFTMQEVINILLAYEELDPSDWERTSSSMLKEWICHNLSYLCNFEPERTRDADLDNEDEDIYNDITLPKLIKSRENYIDQ